MTAGMVSFARDVGRDVPVGTEDDGRHLVAEDRRRAVLLARHHAHLQRDLAVSTAVR
jgi:hypothetical protein